MLGALILVGGQLAAQVPLPVPSLSISAAVARVREASPRKRAAVLLADAAREAARSAGRPANPFIDVRTENWGAPATTGVDLFAEVTQPLEIGGKRRLRQQVASAESAVASTASLALERTLALDTVRAYVRALRARALVDTLTGNRDGLGLLVASTSKQVEDGYTAEADLLKFKTEAARIDGDIARARFELERSLSELGVLIGADTQIEPRQLLEPQPLPVPSPDPAQVASSVAQHPDVVMGNAGVDRARFALAYERARGLPDPAITAGYKRTAGFDTAVVGVSMAVPLFDRNRAAAARAAGLERGAAADRDALVRRLTADTSSLLRAARTLAEQAAKAEAELLAPAEGVRRAALAAFREGTADVLKLIDAERVYADVHRAAIDLRLDALVTTIEARFALGEESLP
ncbi:MAG TPA: TolC family protein [Vicinamibacterales bacterium]|nr:TolC family protein [Vicinamibacterales bacterium]